MRLPPALALVVSSLSAGCGNGLPGPTDRPPDPPASPASVPLVIADVRVVAMTGPEIQDGRTVVIEAGRIAAIGDGSIVRPANAVVVEGRGRYLVPGLIDMHAHLRTADAPAYPAAGVTSIRSMWGWSGLPNLMSRISSGAVAGPTVYSASPGLDGEPVQWPETRVVRSDEDAAAAVAEQRAAGWSAIKVYTRLARAHYQAVVAAATEAGLPVVGHVPLAVPIEEALALGQRSIEHLTGYEQRISRSGRFGTWAWIDAAPDRYPGLAALTVAAGVWNCPTLAVYARLAEQHPAADRQRIVAERRAFVGALHRAGALLVAGSDAGFDTMAPGTSLHDELAELVAAGLSPYQALRAATSEAGRFLGVAGLGTVAAGAPADLLLVEGNPLDRLDRLRDFDGLVHRGAWLPRPR